VGHPGLNAENRPQVAHVRISGASRGYVEWRLAADGSNQARTFKGGQEADAMKSTNEYHEQFQSPGLASWGNMAGHLPAYAQIAFKNILFATDFSSTAELALPYAVEIARRSGATIHAVHVVQPGVNPLVPPSEWPNIAQEEEEFRERKKNQLERELQGLPHEFLMPQGDVFQNLANIIEDKRIDLLVLGTHQRTGMEKVLLGSEAEKIFRQATCAVLTVGPAVSSKASRAGATELNRILYATDFSPESLAAAPYAIYFAKEYQAELILMHSIQNAEPDQVDSAYDTLRDVVPAAADLEFKPRCIVERGAPEDTILRLAAWHDTGMIVLGVRNSQGHPTAVAHFSHSIAYKVVTEAACPVLTVRG
jgi:nucleotide-binding universal stress UspA family protein